MKLTENIDALMTKVGVLESASSEIKTIETHQEMDNKIHSRISATTGKSL